jgi:ParB-like chromosome segregation protein Spo0J
MHSKQKRERDDDDDNIVLVSLNDINVPQRTWEKILRKDRGQVERMRADIESGRTMVRVVLRPRTGGGYDIEDGRHRVIAAKLAGAGFIEALIVGD